MAAATMSEERLSPKVARTHTSPCKQREVPYMPDACRPAGALDQGTDEEVRVLGICASRFTPWASHARLEGDSCTGTVLYTFCAYGG